MEHQRAPRPDAVVKPVDKQAESPPVAQVSVPTKRQRAQALVDALLVQAKGALDDQRLTMPVHDNAYDRYRAVLMLDPHNEQAEAGLQAVLLRYAELVRAALRSGRTGEARELVERAAEYYPGNPLLRDLAKDVATAEQSARRQMQRLSEQDLQGEELLLPARELSRKSEALKGLLAKVAARLLETDESVLIMAPTDAEARWIYKQINDAAGDYRVRGDIRLTSTPKLQFLPPL